MEVYSVYIIWSDSIKKYYVGTTNCVDNRLQEHNSGKYKTSYSSKGIPWILVMQIDDLNSKQAYQIENHIKKMKSKRYIENLIKYPEMSVKLRDRFNPDSYRD
jgi:putative endonuclease